MDLYEDEPNDDYESYAYKDPANKEDEENKVFIFFIFFTYFWRLPANKEDEEKKENLHFLFFIFCSL